MGAAARCRLQWPARQGVTPACASPLRPSCRHHGHRVGPGRAGQQHGHDARQQWRTDGDHQPGRRRLRHHSRRDGSASPASVQLHVPPSTRPPASQSCPPLPTFTETVTLVCITLGPAPHSAQNVAVPGWYATQTKDPRSPRCSPGVLTCQLAPRSGAGGVPVHDEHQRHQPSHGQHLRDVHHDHQQVHDHVPGGLQRGARQDVTLGSCNSRD